MADLILAAGVCVDIEACSAFFRTILCLCFTLKYLCNFVCLRHTYFLYVAKLRPSAWQRAGYVKMNVADSLTGWNSVVLPHRDSRFRVCSVDQNGSVPNFNGNGCSFLVSKLKNGWNVAQWQDEQVWVTPLFSCNECCRHVSSR